MNFEGKVCRLCLKTNHLSDCDKIEDVIRNMMYKLFLNLNLELSEEPVVCKKCVISLERFCEFSSTCIENRKQFIKSEEYDASSLGASNSNGNVEITNILQNCTVCQFCMGKAQIGCCTRLCETKENVFIADIIQKHMPKLSLCLSQAIPVCEICFDALRSFSSFIMNCLEVEERIRQYHEQTNDVLGQVKLFDVQQFIFQPAIKYESSESDINVLKYVEDEQCKNGSEMKSEEFAGIDKLVESIKSDEIEIKSEENYSESDRNSCEKKQEAYAKQDLLQSCHRVIHPDFAEEVVFNCENCSYTTKNKYNLREHITTHHELTESTTFNCRNCSYKTYFKNELSEHMNTCVIVRTEYTCERCSFKTNYKRSLARHNKLIHPDLAGSTTCAAKCKNDFKRHTLSHPDSSYACENCPYKTKLKCNFKRHVLKHQDPSHECKVCTFKTKHASTLRRHELTHQSGFSKEVYQCEFCPFEMKYKRSLERHMMTHHNSADIKMDDGE